MSRSVIFAGALAVIVVGLYLNDFDTTKPDTKPAPVPCPGPGPCPEPHPKKPRPKPWQPTAGSRSAALVGKISLGGKTAPDGATEIATDLPDTEKIRNIGSKRDGAGMCVMSSVENAARWGAMEPFRGLRDWCAEQPGGGYPEKVDRQLKEYCAKKGIPCPSYLQYEGSDPAVLEAAIKSGRMPAVTYSGSDGVRYKGPIAHMVNLAGYGGSWACVLDNNWAGSSPANELLWMTPEEFQQRWKSGRAGWAFVWLTNPPPPPPKN